MASGSNGAAATALSRSAARDYHLVETHTAILLFTPDQVFKLKKPLDLGFLDLRDIESRQRACESEVELNRRLSPDVYLGVAHLLAPDGTLWHPAVVMRRLPDDLRLSDVIRHSTADAPAVIRSIARRIATLHSRCEALVPTAARQLAGGPALRRLWDATLTALDSAAAVTEHRGLVDQIRRRAHAYLRTCQPLLNQRIELGWIRDGHGDLLTDDIFVLPDGPRILDCLEFDPTLRCGDVVGDLAFLAMDLERLGFPELATQLFADYDEFSAENHPHSLEHLYVAYRAVVRAKVDAIRFDQAVATGDTARAESAAAEAAGHLRLAAAHLDAGAVRVVLVGGLPGSGKSTVAEALADRLDLAVVASDVIRRQTAGGDVAPPHAVGYQTGEYQPAATDATYAEIVRRVSQLVRRGVSVVADASWSSPRWRAEIARVVADAGAELVALECRASAEITRERLAARTTKAGWSDADLATYTRMAHDWPEWSEATVVDTTDTVERSTHRAQSVVEESNVQDERDRAPLEAGRCR